MKGLSPPFYHATTRILPSPNKFQFLFWVQLTQADVAKSVIIERVLISAEVP